MRKSGKMADGFKDEPSKLGLKVYNVMEDEYFKFHQSNKSREYPPKGLPRRLMLYINEPMRRAVSKNIQAFIFTVAYRRGFKNELY